MAAANFFAPPLSEQLLSYTSLKQVDTYLSFPKGTSPGSPASLLALASARAFDEPKALSLMFFNRSLYMEAKSHDLAPPPSTLIVDVEHLQIMVIRQLDGQVLRSAALMLCDENFPTC